MDNKTTGTFISARRKELSLNQKQLADRLGVTDKAVSKWETGRSAPDISLLEPLAQELDVSVVEILQGEKIPDESFSAVSDEVVVTTMKTGRKKLRLAVAVTIGVILCIALLGLAHDLGYHYVSSVPVDDTGAIEAVSTEYIAEFGFDFQKGKISKAVRKGAYHFYIIEGTDKAGEKLMSLCIFKRDEIFKNRITNTAGTVITKYEPNEIHYHCSGEPSSVGNVNFNVFFGYDMTDTEYSFFYRGVKYTVPIEEGIFLHPFVEVDHTSTNADIIYDD